MAARFLAFLALTVILTAGFASPAGAETPPVPDHVEGTYAFTFLALDDVTLTADLHVHRTLVGGESLTADEIRREYARYRAAGMHEAAEAFVDQLEERVRAKAERGLADAFPDATSAVVTSVTLDRATLERSSASPTIDLTVTARVQLDRAVLGIDAYSDEDVDAVFRTGARFRTDMRFVAEDGYLVTYRIRAPGALAWEDAHLARVTEDGRTLVAEVDNRGSPTRVVTNASAWLTHPDHAPVTAEDVRTTVTYAIPDLGLVDGALPLEAQVVAEIHAFDLEAHLPDALPERVDLRFVTADDLRDLHARGLVTPADVTEGEQGLLDGIAGAVGDDFEAVVAIDGGFAPASLAADADADAPLTFIADASATYAPAAFAAVPGDVDLMAVLDAGARVVTGIPLSAEPGTTSVVVMEFPAGAVVEDAGADGVVDATGRSVTWTLVNTDGATRLERTALVRLAGADAPVVTGPDARLDVLIDVQDVDVSVTDAAGGNYGRLLVDVHLTGHLNAVEVPASARAKLPDGLELAHVTADGLRGLVDAGILTEDDLVAMEESVLETVRERLAAALGVPATVTGGIDRTTLTAASEGPVAFHATAALAIPLSTSEVSPSSQALALTVFEKEYAFPPIDGITTTYKLLLPRGIALTDARAVGGDLETGREDGRDWLSVTPTDDAGARTTIAMGVTGTFVVVKFWPVFAAAGAGLVAAAGALLVRKAKRRGAA